MFQRPPYINHGSLRESAMFNIHLGMHCLLYTQCCLGDDGVLSLSPEWGKDRNLTALNIASNDFGAPGATALAAALRASFTITSVDCSRNPKIGDNGVVLLIPALLTDGTGASTIRELSLVRCGIGDQGEAEKLLELRFRAARP